MFIEYLRQRSVGMKYDYTFESIYQTDQWPHALAVMKDIMSFMTGTWTSAMMYNGLKQPRTSVLEDNFQLQHLKTNA